MKLLNKISIAIYLVISCIAIVTIEQNNRVEAKKELQNFGNYLKYPLWELNKSNAETYVKVISNAKNYSKFVITLVDGEEYIRYEKPKKQSFYEVFSNLLTQEIEMSLKIYHYDRHLANVNISWESKSLYLYIYFIILVSLILIILQLYLNSKEKKIEEHNRERSEIRHKQLVDTIPHGILELDAYGRVIYVNPAYLKMVGYTKEEIAEKGIVFPSFKEAQKANSILKIIRNNTPSPFPIFFRHKTKYGTIIDFQMDWNYKRDENKNVEGFICAITNITERKKNEKMLKEAKIQAEKANETKSEFLANISHELRTPMHSILSFSNFGIKKIDTAPKEKITHYFRTIHDSAERLMVLLNDLLDLSKLESGKMQYEFAQNDLKVLVNKVITELSVSLENKNLQVIVRNTDLKTSLHFDKAKIGQVVRNLLANAMKFSKDDSKIFIFFETDYLRRGTKAILALKASVEDFGIGIPDSEKEQVFDKFIQSSKTKTGAGGTGLGLAICKEIIQHHKGDIWVETKKDSPGCIFSFALPFNE